MSPPTSEVDSADSPGSAGRGVARVRLLHAALRLADVAASAVGVADTLGLAPGDSVWKSVVCHNIQHSEKTPNGTSLT